MSEQIKTKDEAQGYSIHRMTRDDAALAIEWAAGEGWNPGRNDADCFYRTDPQGFFIGKLKGEPISCISAVAYGDSFGFIGLYIVRPAYRSKGYGIPVWEMAMEYLGYRNVGLDGVIAQQENYQKSGFRLAYRNLRYEGVIEGAASASVVPASQLSLRCLEEYDRLCFPAERTAFLSCWLKQPNATALARVENSILRGYGVIRACRKGYKIGPLFADDPRSAEELFLALCQEAKGQPVYFDVSERNTEAVALAERHVMKPMFETVRMYTQEEPRIDMKKMYGVTTFELG